MALCLVHGLPCNQVLGEEHPHTLITAGSLGNMLLLQGKLADAEHLLSTTKARQARHSTSTKKKTTNRKGGGAGFLSLAGFNARAEGPGVRPRQPSGTRGQTNGDKSGESPGMHPCHVRRSWREQLDRR